MRSDEAEDTILHLRESLETIRDGAFPSFWDNNVIIICGDGVELTLEEFVNEVLA